MKKFVYTLALAAMLLGAVQLTAFAAWKYEVLGPGEAVWIQEESGERVKVSPGTPAPDNTLPPDAASEVKKEGATAQKIIELEGNSAHSQNGQAAQAQNNAGAQAQSQSDAAGQAQDGAAQNNAGAQTQGQSDAAAQQTAQAQADANLVMSQGRQIDLRKPMVALTYDDGPQPSVGNVIMDSLAAVGGRATFFLVGNRVAPYADEVRRMQAEGHEIANHSWDHKYFNHLSAAAIRSEVQKTNEAIQQVSGQAPALMRLPGGNINATVRANVTMPMIYWSIDTLDWKTRNAAKTIQSVLSQVKDGDIILMHELYKQTGQASQTLIPELTKRGFQLVTVSELARFKGHTLGLGVQYSSFR